LQSDTELMLAARGDDVEAVGTLFRRHHAAVYAYCARVALDPAAAADLAQETFLRVFRYRAGFSGAGFAAWLYRIARNVCYDHLRGVQRRRETEARWVRERPDRPVPGERRVMLEAGLARLSAEDREVISLVRFQDLPYEDVAAVLECTQTAARVRLHRALKRLRRVLAELEEGDDELRDTPAATR